MKATITSRFEKPSTAIPSQINATLNSRHDKYPKILKVLARTIHLLGRQGLALRGHRELMEDRKNKNNNPGNFIEFLREIANYSTRRAHGKASKQKMQHILARKVRTNILV